MTHDVSAVAPSRSAWPGAVLPLYTAAIFVSATLLFAVQPMFTKMVLPRLGGAPSVWSVAMVFFQGVLLAGYAYAHALTRLAPVRIAVAIHVAVTLAALVFLPLRLNAGWGDPPADGEAVWLLGLFAVSIGLPFFALAANGPLIQAWFVRTGHPRAADPYFLYAASNIGSFLALLAYPLAIEPLMSLSTQTLAWTGGFVVLIVLVVASGSVLFVHDPVARAEGSAATAPRATPSVRDYLIWTGLAAVPSGLLVAVTAHLSTDVAATPFLWVIPLALYLLTFTIVFSSRPLIPHAWMVKAQPFAIVALVATLTYTSIDDLLVPLLIHLLAFFVMTMVSHGELARRRPDPAFLTAFYLAISFGGMIGGIFCGLIAPRVFSWVAEYPILIVLAALCRPGPSWPRLDWRLAAALVLGLAMLVPGLVFGWAPGDRFLNAEIAVVGAILAGALLASRRVPVFAAVVALVLALIRIYPTDGGRQTTVRSFFGVHKIIDTADGRFRLLNHGTTAHGAQRLREDDGTPVTGRPEPLAYYHDRAPLAQALDAARVNKNGPLRVAAIGLGSGSLACRARDGDTWTFLEIDPDVVRLARDSGRFAFVPKCLPAVPIVIGDARLTLAREPDGRYDVIVVDAFSSDAIPVHLLTREAMAVYLAKLAPGGLVVMHVSNRHMELATVASGIAQANGLVAWKNETNEKAEVDDEANKFDSDVVVAASDASRLAALKRFGDWHPLENPVVWTDDYSNILGALVRNYNDD